MANLLPRLQELATATKTTMMVDQTEQSTLRSWRLRDNIEAVEIACVLKRVQQRDMEKVTRLQIMMNQSHLGVREKLLFVQNLKDGVLVQGSLDLEIDEKFACNSILKKKLRTFVDIDDIRGEVNIMKHLPKHPNIVTIKDTV
ncbi:hypothetical protein Tco_0957313 [Tanacetum coccineum]